MQKKRIVSTVMAGLMTLSLFGCGSTQPTAPADTTASEPAKQEAPAETKAEEPKKMKT